MNLTSSSLERANACLASLILPQHPYQGVDAQHGTENHAKAEDETKLHPKLAELVGTLVDVEKEVSFVLDVIARTVRRTGTKRAYGKLEWYEIGTTPDVVAKGVAVDWKSRKRVESPARNWQVKTHAVVAASEYPEKLPIQAGIGYLDNGYLDMATFGPIEIASAWADLESLCKRVRVARENPSHVETRRGEHCTYCPALTICPAQVTALSAFAKNGITADSLAHLSSQRVGEIHLELKAFEKMLEQAQAAVRARASVDPVPLPNGKVLRLVECSRESVDWKAVASELQRLGSSVDNFKKHATYTQLKETKP